MARPSRPISRDHLAHAGFLFESKACYFMKMNDLPKSLAVVASTDARIYRLYGPVMRKLINEDVTVYAVAPPGKFVSRIEKMGSVFIPWAMDSWSLNPLSNFGYVIALVRIYRRIKPDMVHHFTVKPNVYGAIAAKLSGVPVVFGGVTGLGSAFLPGGLRIRILRTWVWLLCRMAASLSDRVTFQIQRDVDVLLGTSSAKTKALLIPGGSGVDISKFSPDCVSSSDRERIREKLGIEPGTLVAIMVSRLLYDKGVTQYVSTASLVRKRQPNVCFLLVGEPESGNPGSVTEEDLNAWGSEGSIKHVGYYDDIQAMFAIADVVVHPTYYPEGIPRVLIEAIAMGKPIVSTAISGVMEVVEEGVNGILVPPRDVDAMARAIERLLMDADTRRRYGAEGLKKAERLYDDRIVSDRYVAEYRAAWTRRIARRRATHVKESRQCSSVASKTDHGIIESVGSADGLPSVSVIIPARHAEATIGTALDSVLSQDYAGSVEVLVADGSQDEVTAKMVRGYHPSVRLIPNPDRVTSSGFNAALRVANGAIIVRCDAYTVLPPGYVRRAVETLERTGASNVGGWQRPVGTTFFERAVAIAMSTWLGTGGARYRLGGTEGPVDTVYLGVFRREMLETVGGYDPFLRRNQDYELNWRLRERGGTVWFDPDLVAVYRPRGTVWSLAAQYFDYGRWKRVVLRRHPRSLRSRHLAAPLLVLGLVISMFLVLAGFSWLTLVPLTYTSVIVAGGIFLGFQRRDAAAVLVPLVLAVMHVTWGIGFFLPLTDGVREPVGEQTDHGQRDPQGVDGQGEGRGDFR